MNYQSCTTEELTSLFQGGDSYAAHEIARRVSEGLLDSYEQDIYNLEDKIEHQDSEYDGLLEEETRLNQTIEELKDGLSELEFDKEREIEKLEGEVFDLEQ